ncbi:MAG: hypothetical protein JNN17_04925 [Verrucomicrobiaceae bacterium]|nr:hypothetical protein [Verrucomicrobiaceae bacterium]
MLGFKEGDDFYSLGMKRSEFKSKFGPAENTEIGKFPTGYLANTIADYYVNDGLLVTAKADGTIIGFSFYVTSENVLKAASVATDTGISAGVSVREIVRKHGDPFKRKEFRYGPIESLRLYYKYDEAVLSFDFDHGILKSISMNAEYLPYLDQ